MSLRRPFNETPEQRIRRIYYADPDGDVTIHTAQDVEEVVQASKEDFKDRAGSRWSEFQNHVARIPTSIWFKLVREGIVDDEKRFKAWLNDPDNRAFRTRPGRV